MLQYACVFCMHYQSDTLLADLGLYVEYFCLVLCILTDDLSHVVFTEGVPVHSLHCSDLWNSDHVPHRVCWALGIGQTVILEPEVAFLEGERCNTPAACPVLLPEEALLDGDRRMEHTAATCQLTCVCQWYREQITREYFDSGRLCQFTWFGA